MRVENISKSIPFSTFDFQFPESQATNNPNMFQFQQKTPFMSTVPQDVVNVEPIWSPQVQHRTTYQKVLLSLHRVNHDLAISGGGVNRTDDLRVNRTWRFRGGKSYR